MPSGILEHTVRRMVGQGMTVLEFGCLPGVVGAAVRQQLGSQGVLVGVDLPSRQQQLANADNQTCHLVKSIPRRQRRRELGSRMLELSLSETTPTDAVESLSYPGELVCADVRDLKSNPRPLYDALLDSASPHAVVDVVIVDFLMRGSSNQGSIRTEYFNTLRTTEDALAVASPLMKASAPVICRLLRGEGREFTAFLRGLRAVYGRTGTAFAEEVAGEPGFEEVIIVGEGASPVVPCARHMGQWLGHSRSINEGIQARNGKLATAANGKTYLGTPLSKRSIRPPARHLPFGEKKRNFLSVLTPRSLDYKPVMNEPQLDNGDQYFVDFEERMASERQKMRERKAIVERGADPDAKPVKHLGNVKFWKFNGGV